MSREPNPEQKLAIEHTGGVLLSAGAGSGKTFVLERHIIYLTNKWIGEFDGLTNDEFVSYIRLKFKKVVLMTFTKKAAGELELRIKEAFEEKKKESDYWGIAERELAALTIGTIHSFCFKLISQGFFPNIPSGQEVISESEFKSIIEELFDQWISDSDDSDYKDLFYRNRKSLLESLQVIFGDPSLRLEWSESTLDDLSEGKMNKITELLFEEYNLGGIFNPFQVESYPEHSKRPWYDFYKEFESKRGEFSNTYQGLLKLIYYFKQRDFSIPRVPTGKTIQPEIKAHHLPIQRAKDFCKKLGENFIQFDECRAKVVEPWYGAVKSLVNYIESEYEKKEGLTFSDLEFYVLKALRTQATANLISEQYQYFIVDEFQDTSYIQFEILKSLTNENFDKLFCVGDLKQAIYGFRGGELGVFLDCSEKIRENLSLKNNYRSSSAVINFNNRFFELMLNLGMNFEGEDGHPVPYEAQAVPEGKAPGGEICELIVSPPESEEKISNYEINAIEALGIHDHIHTLVKEGKEVAILYRKLKPSSLLIKLLMESNTGFTAQVKIPYLDDPIIGILYSLLEWEMDSNQEYRDTYLIFILNQYLAILGAESHRMNGELLSRYVLYKQYYGLKEAYLSLLNDLGISNANFKNNFGYIFKIMEIEPDNEAIYLKLNREAKESSSVDFKYGENAGKIRIMTTHASKGLEFDHVYLGGIYTNDSSFPDSSLVGKTPASFIWSPSIHGKNRYKTPQMILEDLIWKNKEFSESKRLFYVANTRAVDTLNWISIDFSERKRAKNQKGCWANGLRRVLDESKLATKTCDIEISGEKLESLLIAENRPPVFHEDNIGIYIKEEPAKTFYLPELSVTRLSQIEICPRRYYFSNICKISEEEMELIQVPEKSFQMELTEELTSRDFNSSAQRGTDIHELISLLIKGDHYPESVDMSEEDIARANWAVENLAKFDDNFEVYSEKQIKFELMDYMVSGIPDLIVAKKDKSYAEIWDFKTGRSNPEKLPPYWFQLNAYAEAAINLGLVAQESQIKLVLCFVDEEKLIEQTTSKDDVENYLSERFQLTQRPWEKNTAQCEYCPYRTICEQ